MDDKCRLTIFTPTYNRAYVLPRLYESLCTQSCMSFEWIIVDDGSIDSTRELVSNWLKEEKVAIRYFYQQNRGKSYAHNEGVKMCNTELFTCVDSDDFLISTAVEEIIQFWKIKTNSKAIGILCKRRDINGKDITKWNNDFVEGTMFDAGKLYSIQGDTMLIYKTEILKKYDFPIFEDEKFVPESYLYDLLDSEGVLLGLNRSLYVCEYLEDGYTASIHKLNATNPKGYEAYVFQRFKLDKTIVDKLMDAIRLVSIQMVLKKRKIEYFQVYNFFIVVTFPFGILRYFAIYRKYVGDKK
ncbi:MAG: glycosyltransferase family 2 protein [Ruminococcus flavefaciens]|nr:glycosyltransferase family 2 protein [Ruminococcus flavefaciens]